MNSTLSIPDSCPFCDASWQINVFANNRSYSCIDFHETLILESVNFYFLHIYIDIGTNRFHWDLEKDNLSFIFPKGIYYHHNRLPFFIPNLKDYDRLFFKLNLLMKFL